MNDKELQLLMNKTYSACIKHKELLKQLEAEYEKRYGANPSEIDDDYFIDTFHYGSGNRIILSKMKENAKFCKKIHKC